METEIKEVLSGYLKVEASSINPDTRIDRSALGNSILIHRMYANFSQRGYQVPDYSTVQTFGQLLQRLNGSIVNENNTSEKANSVANYSIAGSHLSESTNGIGIDIESKDNFEIPVDFRENSFYRENFTANEIAYCLLQSEPVLSFAGLFAAKEAVVKAENSLIGKPFNLIEIQHTAQGKPYYRDFLISISHSRETAIAIALKPDRFQMQIRKEAPPASDMPVAQERRKGYTIALLIAIIALLFSLMSYFKL